MALSCLVLGCLARFDSFEERLEHEQTGDHFFPSFDENESENIVETLINDAIYTEMEESEEVRIQNDRDYQDNHSDVEITEEENITEDEILQSEMEEIYEGIENIREISDIPNEWISLWDIDVPTATNFALLSLQWIKEQLQEHENVLRATYGRLCGIKSLILNKLIPKVDGGEIRTMRRNMFDKIGVLNPVRLKVVSKWGTAKASVEISMSHPILSLLYLFQNPSLKIQKWEQFQRLMMEVLIFQNFIKILPIIYHPLMQFQFLYICGEIQL